MGYIFDDDEDDAPHNAKLTPESVVQARAEYKIQQEAITAMQGSHSAAAYAKRLGISTSTMERSLRGTSKAVPADKIASYRKAKKEIARLRNQYSIKAIAKRNGVGRAAMWNALSGKTWANV